MNIEPMLSRIQVLADMRMDDLRALYPENTATRAELVRITRERKQTRGQMIRAIIELEYEATLERIGG